jgi:hypothetical protein
MFSDREPLIVYIGVFEIKKKKKGIRNRSGITYGREEDKEKNENEWGEKKASKTTQKEEI